MSTTRKVKRFNSHSYQLELNEMKKQIEAYSNMLQAIEDVEPEAESIEQLEAILNEKTGFENPRMSAMAFNKEHQFDLALVLSDKCKNINPKDITKDWELTEEAVQTIKEKHTEYFTDEERSARKVLDRVIESYNKLPLNQRRLIGFNYKYQLQFSPLASRL